MPRDSPFLLLLQFLEPDGMFPNHIPNPEDHKAMQMTRDAVLANHADLGIIFDTDVDRAGAVDSSGEEINRNRFVFARGRWRGRVCVLVCASLGCGICQNTGACMQITPQSRQVGPWYSISSTIST